MSKVVGNLPVQQVRSQPIEAQAARDELKGIRANLLDRSGQIRSGYLRVAGQQTLKVGGWLTGGDKAQATAHIRQLIRAGYGSQFATENRLAELDKALDSYLRQTGGAIGSRSFVKMINLLERAAAPPDDSSQNAVAPARANTGRLGVPASVLNSEDVVRMKGNSPIGEAALTQFKALMPHMPTDAFEFFGGLMFPERSGLNAANAVQAPEAPRTFAMGDADGSMGRMVLHAIASGVAKLPENKLPQLALVLGREFGMDTDEDLAGFQSDPNVARALQDIAESIEVIPKPQEGKPACIFLGDILSDRFTNNQEAMSLLIHKLSGWSDTSATGEQTQTGVRFIAGNHDTFALVAEDPNSKVISWGGMARHKLAFEPYRQLLDKCFQAADYSAGVLTTHNGVAAANKPKTFQTGLSTLVTRDLDGKGGQQKGDGRLADGSTAGDSVRIRVNSPEELVEGMNRYFKKYIALQGLRQFYAISTDFRPPDRLMTPEALGFGAIPGFRQLHGHDGSSNENEAGVTNLNARNGRAFNPIAKVIEYPAVQNSAAPVPIWG